MMTSELENPMAIGDYYEEAKVYAYCDECGEAIYEGDWFHIIGHGDEALKVCDQCCRRKVAE